MMEHRWGRREPIALSVVIHQPGRGLTCGRSRDISSRGIFVAAPRSGLAIHSHVEVVLTLVEKDVTRMVPVAAMVVRLSDDGVGLMFAALSAREIRELLARCRANSWPPAVPFLAQAAPRWENSACWIVSGKPQAWRAQRSGASTEHLTITMSGGADEHD